MKVAAAVLGASLLFFVGVLTGAGRREPVPPPAGIPLGGYQSPSGRTAGFPLSGGVTNPLCLRADSNPPSCAPSSTTNA